MNPSKRKGTAFETEVARYLGLERRALSGNKDRGDLIHPTWTLECKATQSIDLAGAVDEARTEAANADTHWFAAIIKRRRKPVSEAYVVMPLSQWAALVGPPPG